MNNAYGYALYAPNIRQKVIGSECVTREQAETLLSDRRANGDAFEGEYVFRETPPPHGCYSESGLDPDGRHRCRVCGVTVC